MDTAGMGGVKIPVVIIEVVTYIIGGSVFAKEVLKRLPPDELL